MVKKSIIAIALMCMLATVSYGQDTWGVTGQVKVDGGWPVTIQYTPMEICRIPIFIKVGMFIEIENCSQKKIVLEQVNCTGGHAFPCYKGCTEIKVRANFEAQLSLKLYKIGSLISGSWAGDNWKAYFTDDDGVTTSTTYIITGDGNWNPVDVCVEAWDVNIYGAGPNTQVQIGEVAVLAMPTGTPDFCDYCDD
ncbi:MAG: hypothetical protein JXA96_13610 [Sedimentisphaerales bacterium]|nr:hypothetical protein [Sedimentisphaerales bacterium]